MDNQTKLATIWASMLLIVALSCETEKRDTTGDEAAAKSAIELTAEDLAALTDEQLKGPLAELSTYYADASEWLDSGRREYARAAGMLIMSNMQFADEERKQCIANVVKELLSRSLTLLKDTAQPTDKKLHEARKAVEVCAHMKTTGLGPCDPNTFAAMGYHVAMSAPEDQRDYRVVYALMRHMRERPDAATQANIVENIFLREARGQQYGTWEQEGTWEQLVQDLKEDGFIGTGLAGSIFYKLESIDDKALKSHVWKLARDIAVIGGDKENERRARYHLAIETIRFELGSCCGDVANAIDALEEAHRNMPINGPLTQPDELFSTMAGERIEQLVKQNAFIDAYKLARQAGQNERAHSLEARVFDEAVKEGKVMFGRIRDNGTVEILK